MPGGGPPMSDVGQRAQRDLPRSRSLGWNWEQRELCRDQKGWQPACKAESSLVWFGKLVARL